MPASRRELPPVYDAAGAVRILRQRRVSILHKMDDSNNKLDNGGGMAGGNGFKGR